MSANAPATYVRGAILGRAVLIGAVAFDDDGKPAWIGRLTKDAGAALDSPWFAGPVGWVLREMHALRRRIPCKDMLGLWEVKVGIAVRVDKPQVAEAIDASCLYWASATTITTVATSATDTSAL